MSQKLRAAVYDAANPINLVPPSLVGGVIVGNRVTVTPGLWGAGPILDSSVLIAVSSELIAGTGTPPPLGAIGNTFGSAITPTGWVTLTNGQILGTAFQAPADVGAVQAIQAWLQGDTWTPQWVEFDFPTNPALVPNNWYLLTLWGGPVTAVAMQLGFDTSAPPSSFFTSPYSSSASPISPWPSATNGTTPLQSIAAVLVYTPIFTSPPVPVAGTVSGTSVTVLFDHALDETSVPGLGAFSATLNAANNPVVSAAVLGSALVVNLTNPARGSDAVALTYTTPGTPPLQDVNANAVVTFTYTTFIIASNRLAIARSAGTRVSAPASRIPGLGGGGI